MLHLICNLLEKIKAKFLLAFSYFYFNNCEYCFNTIATGGSKLKKKTLEKLFFKRMFFKFCY